MSRKDNTSNDRISSSVDVVIMDGSPRANGHLPEHDGVSTQARRADRLRIPTVHEALPFTPFSSIVPFNPGA